MDSDPRLPRHLVLFYQDEDEFADRVSDYLRPAIDCGGSAVLIGTPAHRSLVQARLEGDGLDLVAGRPGGPDGPSGPSGPSGLEGPEGPGGGYLGLDVSETMRRFLVAGWPDPGSFWRVANPLVVRSPRVAETAWRERPVRIVEESVARLWEAGAVSAALEVETMWRELAERHPFALLCAYPARSVAGRHHDAALAQVRRLHDSVVSASTRLDQASARSR